MNIESFTYHSYEMELRNRFEFLTSRDTLSSTGLHQPYASIQSIDSSFSPSAFSSPKPRLASDSSTNDSNTARVQIEKYFTKKKDNFRVLMMNC